MNGLTRDFNICTRWCLYCIEVVQTENGLRFACMLNGKKRSDGTYGKGVPVSVICSWESCDITQDDYNRCYIDVDGGITVSEYTIHSGESRSILTLFADKIRKHQW